MQNCNFNILFVINKFYQPHVLVSNVFNQNLSESVQSEEQLSGKHILIFKGPPTDDMHINVEIFNPKRHEKLARIAMFLISILEKNYTIKRSVSP